MSEDPNKTLEEFRQNWEKEIKDKQNPRQNESSSETETELELAKDLFIEGSKLENKGKVYEALRLYRRAIQLVPDIEFRIYEMQKSLRKNEKNEESSSNQNIQQNMPGPSSTNRDENFDELTNIEEHFRKSMCLSNCVCERNSAPGTIATSTHISSLPLEIIMYILKWVVSNDLDLKSLERLGRVCKGLFLCSRDQEVWRIACMKIWGINCGSTNDIFPSYRDMFVNRPRVNFHGCYISKITYLRYGENSFQDQFYRPVQLVEYYRFIRFFPSGKLVMFTSADEIQTSINRLKNLNSFFQQKDILIGHYKLQDDQVIIVVNKNQYQQKQKRKKETEDHYGNLTFFVELQINKTKKKFTKLTWSSYSAMQIKNGQELLSEFELLPSKYPPFFFSPVKGFHVESNEFLKL